MNHEPPFAESSLRCRYRSSLGCWVTPEKMYILFGLNCTTEPWTQQQNPVLGCSADLVSRLMGLIMACYLGLYGILSGLAKSTDHPSGPQTPIFRPGGPQSARHSSTSVPYPGIADAVGTREHHAVGPVPAHSQRLQSCMLRRWCFFYLGAGGDLRALRKGCVRSAGMHIFLSREGML